MRFFHGTTQPAWYPAVIKNDLFIHAGTRQAALERIVDLRLNQLEFTAWLYELELLPEAVVSANVWHDDLVSDVENYRTASEQGEADAYKYLNANEDKGSMSIYARAQKMKIISQEALFFTLTEWRRDGDHLYGYRSLTRS